MRRGGLHERFKKSGSTEECCPFQEIREQSTPHESRLVECASEINGAKLGSNAHNDMNTKTLFGIFSITLALSTQVQAQSCITDGLVAYYPFNGD
jgi:hypothetical protein